MSSEALIENARQHRIERDKYVYFLLAAAGVSIGFAITQTTGTALGWSQLPFGVGVLLWGLSFVFGCRHLAYVLSSLYLNQTLLSLQFGGLRGAGVNSQMLDMASQGLRGAIELNSHKAIVFAHWQFCCLLIGSVCYVFGHVAEMWLRS